MAGNESKTPGLVGTVGELLDLLAGFDRSQAVMVLLYSDQYPAGSQVAVQGLARVRPWKGWCYEPGELPDIVMLAAHAGNRELTPGERGEAGVIGAEREERLREDPGWAGQPKPEPRPDPGPPGAGGRPGDRPDAAGA